MSYPKDVFSRMFGEVGRIENNLLYPKEEEEPNVQEIDDALSSNIFNVMLSRRSQRRFENKPVEDSKIEMLYAAADTAPTAGGFQGFEIYHVKRQDIKLKLVDAANKQPYVNAPVVLIFCMNPERIKLNFPLHSEEILTARCYSSCSICTAGCTCIRLEFHLDRYD